MIINGDGQICPGIGYEYDNIDIYTNMSMKFNDCYKNIFTDLCDFSTAWKNYDSLYLDECNLSGDSLIEIYDWHLAT